MSVHDLRLTFTDDFLEFGAVCHHELVCGTISGQLKKKSPLERDPGLLDTLMSVSFDPESFIVRNKIFKRNKK